MSSFESSQWEDSSSEEEYEVNVKEDIALIMMVHMEKNKQSKHGGSVVGHEVIRKRKQYGHHRLMVNYFGPNPVYPEQYCRFRMAMDLFLHIANCVKQHDQFFEQRRNCIGDLGHSTIQKVTISLSMMTYGVPADFIDDHLVIGESTSILCVKKFAKAVVEVFGWSI